MKMKRLSKAGLILAVVVIYFEEISCKDIGYFWQVTDFHYDANYSVTGDPNNMCHQGTNSTGQNIGDYGNYSCDAPWKLITSAIETMHDLKSNPDFILWTGDSVPHVDDKDLDIEKVYTLIGNITDELLSVFGGNVSIYPVLGNHDPYPSNMMPYDVEKTSYYKNVLKKSNWDSLLQANQTSQFKHGGYYSVMLSKKIKLLGLNTDLYYSQDKLTKGIPDPADQLKWLDSELTRSEKRKEVVYITAHVSPGVFELVENLTWFYPDFNRKYLAILEKHSSVIQAQFYGHEHTDSFRIMFDKHGKPSNILFLSPAVTPWKSTLEGVGANNPSFRLYHYNRDDGTIEKYQQYYLNLTKANMAPTQPPKWTVEYDTSDVYGLDELKAEKVHQMTEAFSKRENKLFKHYLDYNSVQWQTKQNCTDRCFKRHYCAITQLDLDNYKICMGGGVTTVDPYTQSPPITQSIPNYLYYTIGILGGVVFILFLAVTVLCSKRIQSPRHYKQFGTKSLNTENA